MYPGTAGEARWLQSRRLQWDCPQRGRSHPCSRRQFLSPRGVATHLVPAVWVRGRCPCAGSRLVCAVGGVRIRAARGPRARRCAFSNAVRSSLARLGRAPVLASMLRRGSSGGPPCPPLSSLRSLCSTALATRPAEYRGSCSLRSHAGGSAPSPPAGVPPPDDGSTQPPEALTKTPRSVDDHRMDKTHPCPRCGTATAGTVTDTHSVSEVCPKCHQALTGRSGAAVNAKEVPHRQKARK